MKKSRLHYLVILLISLLSFASKAQYVTKGVKLIDFGIQPPSIGTLLSANAKFGIADNIAIGPQIDYFSVAGNSSWGLFGRGEYHFGQPLNLPDNASLYTGLTLGKFLEEGSEFFGTGLLGGTYLFNDKIGAHAEVRFGLINASGYNSAFGTFSFGLSFRIAE